MLLQFFNYTVTWNLIWISSFIFGGYGAFLLANHFNKNFYTSIIAGIIFTFSTYHMAQSNVHIGLSMIVFIPIFVLILFKISEKNSKIYAILGGVFFFLASMSHVYYFISLLIFSGIFLAFYIFKQKKISNSVFVTNFSITIIIGIIAALIVFTDFVSPESSVNITLESGSLNLVSSVLSGIILSLWTRSSSAITDEFSIISTVSMAKTGTPFRQILLSAFAYSIETPLSLTEIFLLSVLITWIEVKSC